MYKAKLSVPIANSPGFPLGEFEEATGIYQRFMQSVYWNWWCLVADRNGGGW